MNFFQTILAWLNSFFFLHKSKQYSQQRSISLDDLSSVSMESGLQEEGIDLSQYSDEPFICELHKFDRPEKEIYHNVLLLTQEDEVDSGLSAKIMRGRFARVLREFYRLKLSFDKMRPFTRDVHIMVRDFEAYDASLDGGSIFFTNGNFTFDIFYGFIQESKSLQMKMVLLAATYLLYKKVKDEAYRSVLQKLQSKNNKDHGVSPLSELN